MARRLASIGPRVSRVARRSRGPRRLHPSRTTILDAARRLYALSDYSGVTMRAVALEVGCRSPSLYHYFKSKDDIFRELVDAGMALFDAFMPSTDDPDLMAQLRWRFWRYYEFSKAHPEYFRLLFVERSSPVGDETLHARVFGGAETRRRVEGCIQAGLLPSGTDPVRTSVVLCCAIHGAAVMPMREAAPADRDRVAFMLLQLALDGVRVGLLPDDGQRSAGSLGDVRAVAAADAHPSGSAHDARPVSLLDARRG